MIQLNQPYRKFSVQETPNDAVLRDVAIRLITAQEEERSRVAREIHDDLGQKLALLSLNLGRLREELDGSVAVSRSFRNLQDQIEEISTDVHRLAYKLHPARLENLGLVAAIRGLCYELTASGTLSVRFNHKGSFAKLPKELTLCLFRIVQEALRNVVKHSGAESARVFLVNTGEEVRLSISDEGCGFDAGATASEHGLGFTSMRERSRIVGGEICVKSMPSCGTVIEVSIPLAGNSLAF